MATKNNPNSQAAPTSERRADTTTSRVEYTNHTAGLHLPKPCEQPKTLQTLLAPLPKEFSVQTLIVALALLGVYMPRLRFRYTFDVRTHVPVVQVLIEAPQSGNKSIIDFLVARILRRQRTRDKLYRRIEQDWKDNPDSEPDAEGRVHKRQRPLKPVVTIGSTISKTELVIRADTPERLFAEQPLILCLYCEEVQELVDNNRKDFSKLSTAFRKGYDFGSTLDQDYVTSYSATPNLLLTIIAMGTQGGINNFMNDMEIEQGGCTRKIMLHLPAELGSDAPTIRPYTRQEDAEIDRLISTLMGHTYMPDEKSLMPEQQLDMSWLDPTVRKWCEQRRAEVKLCGSLALDTFYKRSSVSAFRLTAVMAHLFELEGADRPQNWRAVCRRTYLYLAGLILDNMLQEWGGQYETLLTKQTSNQGGLKPSLFGECPERFSRDWFNALIARRGGTTPARKFICTWKKAGWIREETEDGATIYIKTEKGHKAHKRFANYTKKGGHDD